MRKLSVEQTVRFNALSRKLDEAWDRLEQTHQQYEKIIKEAFEKLDKEVDSYNDIVSGVNEFIEEVGSEIRAYMDERSERWQESEKGDAYEAWASCWETEIEEVLIEEPEIDLPEYISFDDQNYPLEQDVE